MLKSFELESKDKEVFFNELKIAFVKNLASDFKYFF